MSPFPGIFPHNARAAVSLTYDDALDVHLDMAIPDLEAAELRGTFYVPTRMPGTCWQSRADEWKAAAGRGHEIGNHTQYHPCSADWVKPNFRLEAYSMGRIESELVAANRDVAEALGNDSPRSFAYPCSQDFVGPQRESFRPNVARLFPAARIGDAKRPSNDPMTLDFAAIPSIRMDHRGSAGDAIRIIDDAIESGGWAVFMFHGVGGGHEINVSREVHRAICKHIAMNRETIWCDTFLNVAMHLRAATNRPWSG